MNSAARSILLIFLALGVAVGLYETAVFHAGQEVSEDFGFAWQLVSGILVAMWVEADSRGRTNIYRPFEFGLLILIFSVAYVPYYLMKTRGPVGVAWLLALVIVFSLGFWFQWLVYIAS
jgi:hypothetical protein